MDQIRWSINIVLIITSLYYIHQDHWTTFTNYLFQPMHDSINIIIQPHRYHQDSLPALSFTNKESFRPTYSQHLSEILLYFCLCLCLCLIFSTQTICPPCPWSACIAHSEFAGPVVWKVLLLTLQVWKFVQKLKPVMMVKMTMMMVTSPEWDIFDSCWGDRSILRLTKSSMWCLLMITNDGSSGKCYDFEWYEYDELNDCLYADNGGVNYQEWFFWGDLREAPQHSLHRACVVHLLWCLKLW